MNTKRPNRPVLLMVTVLAGCLCLVQSPAAVEGGEGDVTVLDPPQRYIVVSEKAVLMVGDQQSGVAPRGVILSAIRAKGGWRYSPDWKGWIHLQDLVPVDSAVERFTQRIERNPTAVAYQLRGIAWMAREDWARAAQDFEKSYDLGDSSVSLHFNLGTCYDQLGQPGPALAEFDAILKNFPDEFPSRLARGNLLLQQGQYAPALRDFDQAIALRPEVAAVHNHRGVALRMLGRYEDAIAAYDRALQLDPQSADGLANRAYARKCLGEYQSALGDYEAALVIDPESLEIKNDLAWLLATCPEEPLRNPSRAQQLAESVCAESENRNGEYLDTLAAAYASVGRFEAAIETGKLALTMLGDNPAAAHIRERVQLYEKKQPFVEPAAAGTPGAQP